MIRHKVISFGEVLWDLFPDGARFGGAPANFACHAAIQGANVLMVSAVGQDQRGGDAIESLGRYGIDTRLLQTIADASTGTVGIDIDQNGKPTFEIHPNSAWDRLEWCDELNAAIQSSDAVYFGTLGQRSATARRTIRKAVSIAVESGLPRLLDINIRPPFIDSTMIRESIELASILKLSDDELGSVCSAFDVEISDAIEQTLQRLRQSCGVELLVMTCGPDGVFLASADETVKQDGIPTNVVDTVGAGDSFAATFLLGELARQPRKDSLRRACEVAAATCAHAGAVPQRSIDKS